MRMVPLASPLRRLIMEATSPLVRRLGGGSIAALPRRAFRGEGRIEPRPMWSSIFAERPAKAQAAARAQQMRGMAISDIKPKQGTVTVTIIDPVTAKDGRQIQARIGASVLDVAQEHDMVNLLCGVWLHLAAAMRARHPRCTAAYTGPFSPFLPHSPVARSDARRVPSSALCARCGRAG